MTTRPRQRYRGIINVVLPVCALLVLSAGCTSFSFSPFAPNAPVKPEPAKEAKHAAPSKHSLRVSQFVFLSDFELKPELPLFKDLEKMRDQVHKELELPSANTLIYVYLFEDRERYERYMKLRYPDLPRRRAFFVAQPRSVGPGDELLVYTYWGDRIQQDLRHELTHALLHSVLKDVPLWLDEGLAEYYEQPTEWKGINYHHLEMLRKSESQPYLARLEQMKQVQDMDPREYREAWAWVHWMLRGNPKAKEVLLAYLQQLRTNPTPGPIGPKLEAAVPDMNDVLIGHLARIDIKPAPTAQK
ncbi:MAG: DUF1570 domain-containing protein [Planctomycetia bacterium]|nr:DUF1570 domain-containing protein [Planctomycetia bacterium]